MSSQPREYSTLIILQIPVPHAVASAFPAQSASETRCRAAWLCISTRWRSIASERLVNHRRNSKLAITSSPRPPAAQAGRNVPDVAPGKTRAAIKRRHAQGQQQVLNAAVVGRNGETMNPMARVSRASWQLQQQRRRHPFGQCRVHPASATKRPFRIQPRWWSRQGNRPSGGIRQMHHLDVFQPQPAFGQPAGNLPASPCAPGRHRRYPPAPNRLHQFLLVVRRPLWSASSASRANQGMSRFEISQPQRQWPAPDI